MCIFVCIYTYICICTFICINIVRTIYTLAYKYPQHAHTAHAIYVSVHRKRFYGDVFKLFQGPNIALVDKVGVCSSASGWTVLRRKVVSSYFWGRSFVSIFSHPTYICTCFHIYLYNYIYGFESKLQGE